MRSFLVVLALFLLSACDTTSPCLDFDPDNAATPIGIEHNNGTTISAVLVPSSFAASFLPNTIVELNYKNGTQQGALIQGVESETPLTMRLRITYLSGDLLPYNGIPESVIPFTPCL